jgi:hypothetical protein
VIIATQTGWIRDGNSSLTSGGGPVSPADVTGLVATHEGFSQPDAEGKRNAIIHLGYSVPSGWTGDGVHVFVEAPDGSGSNPRSRLGSFTLGTSALAPEFAPFDAGKFPYDATNDTPAIFELDAPTETESWRVYAVSYTKEIENALLPATETGAPPSTLVNVTPPGLYISGEEWAANVSNFSAAAEYSVSEAGDDIWRLVTSWSNPDDSRRFGVEIVIRPDGTSGAEDVVPSGVLSGGTTEWKSDWWPIGADLHFSAFCVSVAKSGSGFVRNTIVIGVTPRVKYLAAVAQQGTVGQERAPLVTGQSATVVYGVSEAGDVLYGFEGSWSNPNPPGKFRGVQPTARFAGDSLDRVLGTEKEGATTFKTDLWPAPTSGSVAVTIYFVSIDANNRANTIVPGTTPKVDLTIVAQVGGSGVERAPLVTSFGVTVTDAGIDETGGQRYRIESFWVLPGDLSRYRGLKLILRPSGGTGANDIEVGQVAKDVTSHRSEPYPMPSTTETYTLYAVSLDANNRANSIVPGSTPSQVINLVKGAGTLKINRADTSSFNSAEFSTVGGTTFEAVEFSAQKIFVGSILRVGGGFSSNAPSFKGSNGQIAVYNASNVLRAWMGQNGSVFGGWFGEVYIGGTSPTDSPLYANASGVLFVGGNRTGTPYLTVRNNSDVEVGRIGANIDVGFNGAWFKQVRVGGPNISNPVIQSDAAGDVTINGATITLVKNGVTTTINNSAAGVSGFAGVKVYEGTNGVELLNDYLLFVKSGSAFAWLETTGPAAQMVLGGASGGSGIYSNEARLARKWRKGYFRRSFVRAFLCWLQGRRPTKGGLVAADWYAFHGLLSTPRRSRSRR